MNLDEFYEKRPGSGVWYRPGDRGTHAYELRVCQNDECGAKFMGVRDGDKGRFCSHSCDSRHRRLSNAGYFGRHGRVKEVRGPAKNYLCVDGCGRQALDWSQIRRTTGQEPEDYKPRCRSCHHGYDIESWPRGEAKHNAKLTDGRVRGIRASVGVTGVELAEVHGVSPQTIQKARNGKTWKHIK